MKIRHPEIDAVGESSEEAFSQVWEPRGWIRVDDLTTAAIETLGVSVTSIDQLTKQQLLEFGAARNNEVTADMTKDELLAAISANTQAAPAPTFDPGSPDEPDEVNLEDMTKQQLVDLAQSQGLTEATMSKSKSDLIEMIQTQGG